MDKPTLKASSIVEWKVDKPPSNCMPKWVYIGRDEDKIVGAIQIAIAFATSTPTKEQLKNLHSTRKGKSNIQLVVGVIYKEKIWIFGPDERTPIVDLQLDQGLRQLQSALDESNSLNAYTRLGQFRRSLDTTSMVGVTNSGLFASYHIRENVPMRSDWKVACAKAKPWLNLRAGELIKALGFQSEMTAGNALVLSGGTSRTRAVAILLDETEQFEESSARHTGISPVAFGLNVANRQGVNWLFILRKDQIRIYPAKDGVGVGQKGQVETYLEIDLAAIEQERAGLLTLIFSAEALDPDGTINDLLDGSSKFASQLGLRLRERIYEHVVPQLSKSVAEQLREQKTKLDTEGLTLAYRLTLRILFRLLFQAYAEDRGLLPAGRNEGYDANSLKTIAQRIKDTPIEKFGKSKTLWLDLVQVWNAIDQGNETWNVPAYNGGLFGTNPEIHLEGARIETLSIQDDILGPVLQHLLIDISEDDVLGPVDFRSLSVREFGTIYEGLLESSLSVAAENLTVDSKGSWVPAIKNDIVSAKVGDVYFHSASGERKATGSYFTPSVVVDHLIDRSLSPALDAHLLKIKGHLDAGDQAAAARDFFDFRVADLAMGSGHFLVAAVDRIESKMRTFLAENETQVPGVNAQLRRLKEAAKLALGKDESAIGEIETAAFLRRQIARRCIYGLDVNPLAVELARLALWIHTFVPGLPMSNLDHGLVCANSLTGIGTIDEALNELSPDIATPLGKQGTGIAISFFADGFQESLANSRELLLEMANADEANKNEVAKSLESAKKAKLAAQPALEIFNCALAARLELIEIPAIYEQSHLLELARKKEVTAFISSIVPAHMPYLFPEVFSKENPGFDVLIGNPPWEKLHVEEHQWWGLHLPGLRSKTALERGKILKDFRKARPDLEIEYQNTIEVADKIRNIVARGPFPGIGASHLDLYQAFAWRNWALAKRGGSIAVVLPRTALSGSSLQKWREEVLLRGSFKDVCTLRNSGNWVFEGVDGRYTFALVVVNKEKGDSVNFTGPFSSQSEFLASRSELVSVSSKEFISWSETNSFPMIESVASANIFRKMRKHPQFNSSEFDFEFRPIQGDLNASSDKDKFIFDLQKLKSHIPVLAGASFNFWNPDFGKPYALAPELNLRKHLQSRISNSSTNTRSAYFNQSWPKIDDLPFDYARIAYRNLTNSTNTRTLIAALLPPGVVCSHQASILVRRKGDERDEAFLLAILSSIPLDWYLRRWVELTLSFEILNCAPIPNLKPESLLRKKIIEISGRLAAKDKRFQAWAKKTSVPFGSIESDAEMNSLRFELNALVGLAYGLDQEEIQHIYETFHKGWDYQFELQQTLAFMQNFRRKHGA